VHRRSTPLLVERLDRRALASEGVARPREDADTPCVSVGRPIPHVEVQIRDAGGRVLEERRAGTIWIRSNSLFSGYHGNPELTARVRVDGWLDTGDRGFLADGNLFFLSREKDLLVVGGAKFAPQDVENVVSTVAGVREGCVVVFGVLNEERGTEDLAAVAETREEAEDAQARLRETIRAEVTRATGLALRHVLLVPPGGIEKTTSGKLARRATHRRYADRLVGR
jgi:acyl-CoA synthetase (AMP-forming)/AMP-acid ligase II